MFLKIIMTVSALKLTTIYELENYLYVYVGKFIIKKNIFTAMLLEDNINLIKALIEGIRLSYLSLTNRKQKEH